MIETNFRKLKMFFGLITSLPRSVNGYFGNYTKKPQLCEMYLWITPLESNSVYATLNA
jgi:hypothetical protein